jgi:serine/threonine protein kinase
MPFTQTSPPPSSPPTTQKPVGGATYDFLDPTLMTKASASNLPTPQTDIWSLAMTLLVFVIGVSPYSRVASNEFMKKECIKQGTPLAYMSQGENGMRNAKRMAALSKSLGFDVKAWFGMVLVKDGAKRVGVKEWRAELERRVAQMHWKI